VNGVKTMDEKDELNIPALSFQEDNKQRQSTEQHRHEQDTHDENDSYVGGAPRRRTTNERGSIPRIVSNGDESATSHGAEKSLTQDVNRISGDEEVPSTVQDVKVPTNAETDVTNANELDAERLSTVHVWHKDDADTARSLENVRTIKLEDDGSVNQQTAQSARKADVETDKKTDSKKEPSQSTRRPRDGASTDKKTKVANGNGSNNNWYAPFFISLMGALVGCLLFVAVFGLTNAIFNSNHAVDQNTKSTHEYIPPQGNETETSAVVAAVTPGIVTVLTGNRQHYLSGNGSGIVYKEQDGKIYILTNAHVIASAAIIEVYRNDLGAGSVDRAEVLATDDVNDIAVLVIEKPQQSYPVAISFEDSTKLKVGQKVVAIGSPYVATLGTSFSGSVTEGIVSGLNREIEASREVGIRRGKVVIQKYIQTDAAINGGNSGGALIDMSGNLIGMNSARINSADNIGFAIATNDIIAAMKEMNVPLPTNVR